MKRIYALAMTLFALTVAARGAETTDKGFDVTTTIGNYIYTVTCHYEPEIFGEITSIGLSNEEAKADTMRMPSQVEAYGDTFPVTSVSILESISEWYKMTPRVIDFGTVRTIEIVPNNPFNSQLEEIILGEEAQTLDCSLKESSIKTLDLKNVSTIYSQSGRSYSDYGMFSNNKTLTEIRANNIAVIPDYTFYGATNLRKADFHRVKKIGIGALAQTAITTLDVSTVDSIMDDAFNGAVNLSRLNIPETIKYVGSSAFDRTALISLNMYDAELGNPFNGFMDMDSLLNLSSERFEYLRFYNEGMTLNTPSMLAIKGKGVAGIIISGMEKLRELEFTDCCIDRLEIPDSLYNGFAFDSGVTPIKGFWTNAWYAIRMNGTAVGEATLTPGNPSYILRDSLLLALPQQEQYWCGNLSVLLGPDLEPAFRSLKGYPIKYATTPQYAYTKGFTDTVAVAAVGFPKGDWFVPYNNRYNGVTYNIDYVERVLISADFSTDGYFLKTFRRPVENPVKIYIDQPTDSVPSIAECCPTEAVEFVVPKGKLGRYIAAGLPASRTIEDTDGILGGIESVIQDNESTRREGTFTIDGRHLPDDATLLPGIYIINGRKVMIR